jgi:hypothetical protein
MKKMAKNQKLMKTEEEQHQLLYLGGGGVFLVTVHKSLLYWM